MNHLTITEQPAEQKRQEPGKVLRGEQKHIAEEIAPEESQKNREGNTELSVQADLSGW